MNLMKTKNKKVFLSVLVLATTAIQFSCGLINDQDRSEDLYEIDNLNSICKIDTDKFKKIISQDVTHEINCLEKNLSHFAQYVRRNDQEVIEKDELKRFVEKFMDLKIKNVDTLLSVIFQINSLVLNDDPNSIKVSNIKHFINLIHILNEDGSEFKNILDKMDQDGYFTHRDEMVELLQSQSVKIKGIIKSPKGSLSQVHIMNFLTQVKDTFELPKDLIDLDMVESMLFFKKLFIGGNSSHISGHDLEILVERMPRIIKVFFDALNVNLSYFNADHLFYEFHLENLDEVEDLLLKHNLNEFLIDHPGLMKLASQIIPSLNWEYMSRAILNLKRDFTEGKVEEYTYGNLRRFLKLYREGLELRYFNSQTFELLKPELQSPMPIFDLKFPGSQKYSKLTEERHQELWREFLHIIKNHRVFANNQFYVTFNNYFLRDPYGINLIGIERWFLSKIYVKYSSDKGIDFQKNVDKEQLRIILSNYREILEELEIMPDDFDRMIRELNLASDLFQFSSNGDNKIQLDEIAQLIPMIISSNSIGAQIYDKMNRYCDPMKVMSGFEIDCYRENFFPIMFYQLSHDRYYPNMFNFFKENSFKTLMQYLTDIEGQAKLSPSPLDPITKNEMERIVTSISNIENVFLRFDLNRDGILEGSELNNVYKIFENTLASISNLKPGNKLLRSLFLYIVKKKRLPNNAQLVVFHVIGRKKNIKATRSHVAAILGMIGKKLK